MWAIYSTLLTYVRGTTNCSVTAPSLSTTRYSRATHRVPGLSVVCEDMAPGVFEGVVLQLGASELARPSGSYPPLR